MTRNMIQVPDPMFFRQREHSDRKLNKQEKKTQNCYQIVPRFFDLYHPTTTWLVNVIRSENEKELSRVLMDKETKSLLKFEPDPRAIQAKKTVIGGDKNFIITKAKYFQILDRPEFYNSKESRAPLFNRHAVMYLTPLGLAIYMRKPKAASILVQCIDRDTNKKHIQARQPQFITFINERFGDLMCLYDHNLAILNETYDILTHMLRYDNWFPAEPHKLVYRKRFAETYLNFDDFLDFAFYVMFTKRSSIDIPSLVDAVLKCPSEHFRFNYMSQPSRATKLMLLRDADRIINNCKTYPRRLLRCAFYADKKVKSTMNLVRAAAMFINKGLFKLVGESAMPFISKPTRRRRLETMPVYKERGRGLNVEWPNAYYEFDADCCIALLVGLVSKCYRLAKKPTFALSIRTAVKVLADAGWLNYFDIISDLEFKDYFMGMDDAEKVRFQPEIFAFVRECARITVIDQRHELARFFSEERLDREIRALHDLRDPQVLTRMLMCSDENISKYVMLGVGEELKPASTIIGGKRVRGQGRNDPKNKYYMDKLEFPRESVKTVMTNTANTEDEDSSGGGTSSEDDDGSRFGFQNRSNRLRRRERSRRATAASSFGVEDGDEYFDDDVRRMALAPLMVEAEVYHDGAGAAAATAAVANAESPHAKGWRQSLALPQRAEPARRAAKVRGSHLPVPTKTYNPPRVSAPPQLSRRK